MNRAARAMMPALSLLLVRCDREPEGITRAPERATTASVAAATASAKREPVEIVVIDRTACARLGVSVDDVLAALKAAKLTVGEPRAATEDGLAASIVEVKGVRDPAELMAMRLGETGAIVVAQVARFEVRRR
jgi:hypothetical protein